MKCRICDNQENNNLYEVIEMMFGYRDKFTYFQCSECGCLQILEIPLDMSKYYSSKYYSFSLDPSNLFTNPIKKLLKKLRDSYAVFNKGIIGKLIYTQFPNEDLRSLSRAQLTKNSRVLDVGCGTGSVLYFLKEIGFKNLLGIDPYIKEDIGYENGLKILKKTIHNLDGNWDLIMFHHSFEHIPDPFEVLQSVSRLLTKEGVCIIRIPTVSSHAWEHYGVKWVQLDAPRHFFLHSIKSIKILVEKANFNLEKIVYDSSDFQFWGSEQYITDIPLLSEKSYAKDPSSSIFSDAKIKVFKQKARKLNLENLGDQAAFYLKKKAS